jgi:hypothetical protein
MKSFLTAVAVAATLVSSAACAQERVADAALGGLSGALVLGPVGAVAGVVIGFTAGPSISRSWGVYPDYRYPDRVAQRSPGPRSTTVAANQAKNASAAPGRQAGATADSPASSVKSDSAPAARPAWKAPPVLGFE